MDQPRVFRPTLDIWFGRAVLPPVFFSLLALTAADLFRDSLPLLLAILTMLLIFLLVWLPAVNQLLKYNVMVDRLGITFYQMEQKQRINWSEVRALMLVQRSLRYLLLATSQRVYSIPVEFLNADALWQTLERLAPPAALRGEAKKVLETQIQVDNEASLDLQNHSLRITDNRALRVASILGTLVMLVFSFQALGQGGGSLLFYIAFSMLYLINIVECGSTEFDAEGITRRTLLGTARMRWDEIQLVEIGPLGMRISLEGENGRRLAMFGVVLWTGPDAMRAAEFFGALLASRRVDIRNNWAVLLRLSRHTRL